MGRVPEPNVKRSSGAGLVNLKGLTQLQTLNLNEAGHFGPLRLIPPPLDSDDQVVPSSLPPL